MTQGKSSNHCTVYHSKEKQRRISNKILNLRQQHNPTGLPGLVKPGFQRAVESQYQEPALARHGLNPVLLFALGRLGREIDVGAAVGVDRHLVSFAADAWEILIGLEQRPRLGIGCHVWPLR